MRKTYTLAFAAIVAAACAVSASAQTFTRLNSAAVKPARQAGAPVPDREFADETWKDLGQGKFCDPAMVNMFDNYSTEEVEVQVQESEEHPGVYRIVTPWPMAPSHPEANFMIVDARDPEYVHIPGQPTPVYEKSDGVTWICSQSYYGLEYADSKDTKEDFLAYFSRYNITREGDVITFPAGCVMYMWPNATSPFAGPGEWVISYNAKNSGYLILPGEQAGTEQWEELGLGEMCDGFLASFLNPSLDSVTCNVLIYADTRKPGMYKLESPFKYITAECYDLIIDATIPDFVRIHDQNTGIPVSSGGEDWGKMWCYSFSSLYNFPTLDALEANGYGHLNITMKDDIIRIPPQSIVFYFPAISQLEYYNNEQAIDSYISLPGAASVASPVTEDASPEYFTLQGVRVSNPQPGTLLIERRGAECRKIIF